MTVSRGWRSWAALGALALAAVTATRTDAAAAADTCEAPTQQTAPTVPAAASGYLTQLQPERAWALTRGAGVTVALLDTGVSAAAAAGALAGRVVDGGNLTGDGQPTALVDCDGRGTADAGLIASPASTGSLPGVAPDARILAVRVQSTTQNAPTPDVLARGIDTAAQQGAKVIVIASPAAVSAGLASSVGAAVAAGIVVVAAIGDEAGSTTSYPARYPDVVGVAPAPTSSAPSTSAASAIPAASATPATSATPAGTSTSAVRESAVDLTAPATGLAGLSISGQGFRLNLSGSAPAAALIGATAALVRARHPSLPVRSVVALLEQSAGHPATPLPDPAQGWGMVNPYAAVTIPLTATVPPTPAVTTAPAVALPPPYDSGHDNAGALLAVALLVLAAAALAAIAALRAARRRRWRPGTGSGPAPDPEPERAISPSELGGVHPGASRRDAG